MEEWTAAADEPTRFSQARLEGCDLCVLIVAFRRGYVPPGERLSITQMEYQAAVQSGIDVLVFMLDEDAPWPRRFDELDKDAEMRIWRKQLVEKHGVGFFNDDPKSVDIAPALTRWVSEKKGQKKLGFDLDSLPRQLKQAGRLIDRGAIREGLLKMRSVLAAVLRRHLPANSDVEISAPPMHQLRSLAAHLPEGSLSKLEFALSTAGLALAHGDVSIEDAIAAVKAAADGLMLVEGPRVEITTAFGQYSFSLVAATNTVLLTGEKYASKPAMLNGLSALKHVIRQETSIRRKTLHSGEVFFVISGPNGERLATSDRFCAAEDMEKTIHVVQRDLSTAPICELA